MLARRFAIVLVATALAAIVSREAEASPDPRDQDHEPLLSSLVFLKGGGGAKGGTAGSSGGAVAASGHAGTDGKSGAAGKSGGAGESAAAGKSGATGTGAAAGNSGAAGTGAAAGNSGTAGTGGASGESGAAGAAGKSGAAGSAGAGGSRAPRRATDDDLSWVEVPDDDAGGCAVSSREAERAGPSHALLAFALAAVSYGARRRREKDK